MKEGQVIDVTPERQGEEEVIGALVIRRDAMLTQEIMDGKLLMEDYLSRANALVLKTEKDIGEAKELIAEIKEECEPIIEKIKPFKDQFSEKLEMIRSIEKVFTVTVGKPQQAAAMTDPRCIAFQAVSTIKGKINDCLDAIEKENERKAREAEEKARKEQEARLSKINAGLDKLLAKAGDLAGQKGELEKRLEDQNIAVEEAEVIRARIEKIETQLGNVQAKTAEKQMEQYQVAAPVTVPAAQTKVSGVSSRIVWIPAISNPKLLLQAILNGSVPMSAIKWDMAAIKQYGNMMVKGQKNIPPTVPGVAWTAERATSVRG